MEFHPAADIFPLIEGQDFENLKADIAANGQRESIKLFANKILDGRNRYLACKALDREPVYEVLPINTDPIPFVVSLNLHRRHLTDQQRKMVAGKIANMNHGGDRTKSQSCDLVSQSKAAALLDVSKRGVEQAARVHKHAIPEIREAAEREEVSLSDAATIAKEAPEVQRQALRAVRERQSPTLAKAANGRSHQSNGTATKQRGSYDDTQRITSVLHQIISDVKDLKALTPKKENRIQIAELARDAVAALERFISHIVKG